MKKSDEYKVMVSIKIMANGLTLSLVYSIFTGNAKSSIYVLTLCGGRVRNFCSGPFWVL